LASPAYTALIRMARGGLGSEGTTGLISDLVRASLALLEETDRVDLISSVPGKAYFAFQVGNTLSGPIRIDLFDPAIVAQYGAAFVDGTYGNLNQDVLERLLYTMAISYRCEAELRGTGDRKRPATFFEVFIGNLFARSLGVNPTNQIEVLTLQPRAALPTDFIFDPGPGRRSVHMPVKLSTRERVIQAWAHQRVLDGVFGVGRFRGVLVVLSETKLDRATREVIEICLPEQWRVYQLFIAQMFRVYYLDVPVRYAALPGVFPNIQVGQLSLAFTEIDALTAP
jgi:hypothetical protein